MRTVKGPKGVYTIGVPDGWTSDFMDTALVLWQDNSARGQENSTRRKARPVATGCEPP
jgi:hypothetical protein